MGVRSQVGRGARDRLLPARAASPAEPQRQRRHPRLPGAARAEPRAGLARGDPRRRDRRLRRRAAVRASRRCSRACTSAARRRCAVSCGARPSPMSCSTCCGWTGTASWTFPTYERRERLEELGLEGAHWRIPGAAGRRRRGLAGRHARAGHGGDRRQAPRFPLHARAARRGLDQDQEPPAPGARDRRLDRGQGRARAGRSGRSSSASTTSGRAAPRRARRDGLRRGRARAARRSARAPRARGLPVLGPAAAARRALRGAAPGVRGRIQRVDARRQDPPGLLQGSARGQGPRPRWCASAFRPPEEVASCARRRC